MRGWLLHGHGCQEQLEYRTDLPVPEPGAGEVLVRVGACSVNNTDLWTREGAYGGADDPEAAQGWQREPMQFPRIQGGDIAGEIVGLGENVPEARLGERVMVNMVLYADAPGREALYEAGIIGSERDGGFAEYASVPAGNAYPISERLSFAEASSFICAYHTAEGMLARAGLQAGQKILIAGASGGVGSALVQLAKAREAEVAAITQSDKAEALLALGADHIIRRDGEELETQLKRIGWWEGTDVVADVVGGPIFRLALHTLRKGGAFVNSGAIAEVLTPLDLRTLYLRHLNLLGSSIGMPEDFERVRTLAESGRIRPLIDRTFGLEQLLEAQQYFEQKQFIGKLIIQPH